MQVGKCNEKLSDLLFCGSPSDEDRLEIIASKLRERKVQNFHSPVDDASRRNKNEMPNLQTTHKDAFHSIIYGHCSMLLHSIDWNRALRTQGLSHDKACFN